FTTRPSPTSLPHGPMMGRSGTRSWPVYGLLRPSNTSIPACSMATGPPPSPQKGGGHGLLGVHPSEGREGHGHHRQSWLCVITCRRRTRQRERKGLVTTMPPRFERCGDTSMVQLHIAPLKLCKRAVCI